MTRVLLIRRDNIGDLILTTPLIEALAAQPGWRVDVLVNSYNEAILDGNPDVARVYRYKKLHHRDTGESAWQVIAERIRTVLAIRRARYDIAVVAKEAWDKRPLQWATLARAKRIVALCDHGRPGHPRITDLVTAPEFGSEHLVERLHRLLAPLGIVVPPGPLRLFADEAQVAGMRARYGLDGAVPVYALQLSARKLKQRWPVERFAELATRIAAAGPCKLVLLWSPGAADDPRHPGDDDKAAQLVAACPGLPLVPVRTTSLAELKAAMQLCDQVITADGGAMHVAAGLGKPVVALFGNSNAAAWAPWGVPHEILQTEARDVNTLGAETVFAAHRRLLERSPGD
ncbi:glycosyltransferase family 9 protein [Jeongeupia naejangsanensis]|uniref:Glycosyltransferase family 9 protein n=1 Tax=Jeongeupia naejangsanensis TaxID=613195 RepID=A0ABS2BP21_9NEIS|nr:glycosyltransferase family 9 protein [Jeongeupia naejangsanensis]MBM3116539.1 glycosyltransferase family 9 protein [Jeongeupia naejangsanensis]